MWTFLLSISPQVIGFLFPSVSWYIYKLLVVHSTAIYALIIFSIPNLYLLAPLYQRLISFHPAFSRCSRFLVPRLICPSVRCNSHLLQYPPSFRLLAHPPSHSTLFFSGLWCLSSSFCFHFRPESQRDGWQVRTSSHILHINLLRNSLLKV